MPMADNVGVYREHSHNAPLDKKVCAGETLLMVELVADNANPFTNPHSVKFISTDQGVPTADGVEAVSDTAAGVSVSDTPVGVAVSAVSGWEATVAVALGASEPMT